MSVPTNWKNYIQLHFIHDYLLFNITILNNNLHIHFIILYYLFLFLYNTIILKYNTDGNRLVIAFPQYLTRYRFHPEMVPCVGFDSILDILINSKNKCQK